MSDGTKKYVVLCFFNVTPKWLSLKKPDRVAFRDRCFGPIFGAYRDRVRPRVLDTWAFTSKATDILMFETTDICAYYELMDELKNTELFANGFIERSETIVSVEDGFLG